MAKTKEQILKQVQEMGYDVENLTDLTSDILANSSRGRGVWDNLDLRISVLEAMKKDMKDGNLSITDYASVADDLGKGAVDYLNQLTTHGKGNAEAAMANMGRLKPFIDLGPSGREYADFKVPFTRNEYARLDESVLPTQDDVAKGLISRTAVPFERYRATNLTDGQTSAQENNVPGSTTAVTQDGTLGTTVGGAIPTDIDLRTDRGEVETEAQRQAKQLQVTLEQQKALREESLAKLSKTLADSQMEQFNRAIPNLAEQANTAGIYRSTGFGDILARQFSDLEKDRQTEFAKQAYGISDQYASGLGDVANTRVGLQTGGLQRQFSLEDAERSLALAQQMSQQNQASGSSGKSGSGVGTLAGAAIGGLGAGLATGGLGAGQGAALGAQIGGSAGSGFRLR